MMESAHLRDRDDPSRIRWLDGAWLGRILLQAQVGPAAMMVGQEPLKVPVQASLVEHDHVVQALAAKGTDSVRLDDAEGGAPFRPCSAKPSPQEPVERGQSRLLHRALQDAKLMAQSGDLKLECGAAAKRREKGREER